MVDQLIALKKRGFSDERILEAARHEGKPLRATIQDLERLSAAGFSPTFLDRFDAAQTKPAAPSRPTPPAAENPKAAATLDQELYELIRDSKQALYFDRFVANFPKSVHAEAAAARARELLTAKDPPKSELGDPSARFEQAMKLLTRSRSLPGTTPALALLHKMEAASRLQVQPANLTRARAELVRKVAHSVAITYSDATVAPICARVGASLATSLQQALAKSESTAVRFVSSDEDPRIHVRLDVTSCSADTMTSSEEIDSSYWDNDAKKNEPYKAIIVKQQGSGYVSATVRFEGRTGAETSLKATGRYSKECLQARNLHPKENNWKLNRLQRSTCSLPGQAAIISEITASAASDLPGIASKIAESLVAKQMDMAESGINETQRTETRARLVLMSKSIESGDISAVVEKLHQTHPDLLRVEMAMLTAKAGLNAAEKKTSDAVPLLTRARDLFDHRVENPTWLKATQVLAKLHSQAQRPREAIALLEQALPYDSSAETAVFLAAVYFDGLTDVGRAIPLLERACRTGEKYDCQEDPNLAEAYLAAGRTSEALSICQYVERTKSSRSRQIGGLHIVCGLATARTGDSKRARNWIEDLPSRLSKGKLSWGWTSTGLITLLDRSRSPVDNWTAWRSLADGFSVQDQARVRQSVDLLKRSLRR